MIERYALPEMAVLFTDGSRLAGWLEVELLAVEAWAKLGVAPSGAADEVRRRAPIVDGAFVARVEERERVTDHDVAAFVDVVQELIGPPESAWIHYGLTSSDVVDTALCATLRNAGELLLSRCDELVAALARRAEEFATTPITGRTHGMAAEPTTFGEKLALFGLQALRDRRRLADAVEAISVGKVSGAVGTYSNVDPAVEAYVCAALGLEPVPASQVVARDRHAQLLYATAATGTTIEALATEIRHLQRSEVGEVEEPFGAGQKGSSAMPHKRNPIVSERLVGLARVLRGYLVTGLENVALWHERDISHSSAERVILPDAIQLCYYALVRATWLVDGLVVHVDKMRENLTDHSLGVVFSQSVLLALVERGVARDVAYRIVQRAARRANEAGMPFRTVLRQDAELAAAIGPEVVGPLLDGAFDLDRVLSHAHRGVDALKEAMK
ncbi:MAG: adenylosuccinate lyase [Acidimicrobiales bacterium]